MDCTLPGSSVHGILQARILEWAAMPFSMGSFQPGNRIQVSHVYLNWQQGSLPLAPTGKPFHMPLSSYYGEKSFQKSWKDHLNFHLSDLCYVVAPKPVHGKKLLWLKIIIMCIFWGQDDVFHREHGRGAPRQKSRLYQQGRSMCVCVCVSVDVMHACASMSSRRGEQQGLQQQFACSVSPESEKPFLELHQGELVCTKLSQPEVCFLPEHCHFIICWTDLLLPGLYLTCLGHHSSMTL